MQHEKKHVFKNFFWGGGIESTLKTIVQHEKNMYVKSLFYFTSGWWVGTGRRMSSTCS